MPELIQVSDDVYYISEYLNHGIVRVGEGQCAIIDTGLDSRVAAMIAEVLKVKKLHPVAILNTHSHADHYGGNSYFEKEYGCEVYASEIEAAIMANPELEPFYVYGAYTPKEMRQSSVMGTKSIVTHILEEPSVSIGNKRFEIVSLKGHSPNQVGVVADDVFFCGDSIFSKLAWERFVLIYLADIGNSIKSLERLSKVGAKSYIPAHIDPIGDPDEFIGLVQFNLTRIQVLADEIVNILAVPAESSTVLQSICDNHNLKMKTIQQYYFSLDTVKAYLSYLYENEMITYKLDGGLLLWKAV
jgi:glyoxylase-like metal-dependent hydrolase (beta-lactamase superfamily II)